MGHPALIGELLTNHSAKKTNAKFGIFIIAFALGCLALANPRRQESGIVPLRKGIDLMVALDVSNSMMAADQAINRLDQAKLLLSRLIKQSENDRLGLVLFAGKAFIQMPLTYDHNAAQLFISGASPATIKEQGTALAEALERCDVAFDQQSERFKAIILLSDGETHDEGALKIAEDLSSKGIMINTVGIGTTQGATIMDTATKAPKLDASGQIVVSRLNEQLLRQIAEITNGSYLHLGQNEAAISELKTQLSQIEKKALGDTSQFQYATFYFWLALPMLLLLVGEIFIGERKKVRP